MSGYLATSPNGPLPYHRWDCCRCPESGGGLDGEREQVREAARDHIEHSGHSVDVFDGTSEHLYPVATTVASSEPPS